MWPVWIWLQPNPSHQTIKFKDKKKVETIVTNLLNYTDLKYNFWQNLDVLGNFFWRILNIFWGAEGAYLNMSKRKSYLNNSICLGWGDSAVSFEYVAFKSYLKFLKYIWRMIKHIPGSEKCLSWYGGVQNVILTHSILWINTQECKVHDEERSKF